MCDKRNRAPRGGPAGESPRATARRRGKARAACASRTLLPSIALALACGGQDAIELPQPLASNPSIAYPVDLWDTSIEGETVILVHVDAEGGVESVRVAETSGSPRLDSAAVEGGRRMRFSPGRRGDRRVGAWVRIPIRFRRDSVEVGSGR